MSFYKIVVGSMSACFQCIYKTNRGLSLLTRLLIVSANELKDSVRESETGRWSHELHSESLDME